MTLQALNNAIGKLIMQRWSAYNNITEQDRINAKLDKLYNLKRILLEMEAKNNG